MSLVSLFGLIEPLKDTGTGRKRELERIDFPVGHVACFAPLPLVTKFATKEVTLKWAVHSFSSSLIDRLLLIICPADQLLVLASLSLHVHVTCKVKFDVDEVNINCNSKYNIT